MLYVETVRAVTRGTGKPAAYGNAAELPRRARPVRRPGRRLSPGPKESKRRLGMDADGARRCKEASWIILSRAPQRSSATTTVAPAIP